MYNPLFKWHFSHLLKVRFNLFGEKKKKNKKKFGCEKNFRLEFV